MYFGSEGVGVSPCLGYRNVLEQLSTQVYSWVNLEVLLQLIERFGGEPVTGGAPTCFTTRDKLVLFKLSLI